MESSAISLLFSLLRRSSSSNNNSTTSNGGRSESPSPPNPSDYLINLIDSPGHIDFSSEVSTASRLSDGALILVDAVEGVCSQTVTVLRQAWLERLRPLLVVNKMDRLITELKMSPAEAYAYLSRLLEQVNAVMGTFFQGERMEDDLRWRERVERAAEGVRSGEGVTAGGGGGAAPTTTTTSVQQDDEGVVEVKEGETSGAFEEKDDEDIYFAPEKNNVIFSSALDGWAFTVKQFAALYEKKLGIKRAVLEKVLWGDFYLDPKTKRVLGGKHLKGRALKPMFVQLVLENVWAVYEATTGGDKGKGDPELLTKITRSLSISLPPHLLRSRDPRAILTAVFSQWLPLSTAILVSVIEQLPSSPAAQAARMPAIVASSPGADHVDKGITAAMTNFATGEDDPKVAFVSKMVAVRESELPEMRKGRNGVLTAEEARELGRKKRAEIARARAAAAGGEDGAGAVDVVADALGATAIGAEEEPADEGPEKETEDPEHLIGFARLYSGTLAVGDEVYVLPPKFSPAHPHTPPVPQRVTITALYLLMGRSLEPLRRVPAGTVFGVRGLAGAILKSGTLCSALRGGVNLAGVSLASKPIVRVALEPANPADLDKLVRGLRMLEQSDACAEYEVLESGEHVVLTAGELHLERCLKDLRERFARCDVQQGEPIVPYRESIVAAAEMNPPREGKDAPRGKVAAATSSRQVTVRVRVRPLPPAVTAFLVRNGAAVKRLYAERRAAEEARKSGHEVGDGEPADVGRNGDAQRDDIGDDAGEREDGAILSLADFRQKLKEAFAESKAEKDVWASVVDKITAFGPRRVGPNLLIDETKSEACTRVLRDPAATTSEPQPDSSTLTARDFSDKISYAFQLATAQGPLCHEPMQGVAVFLEDVNVHLPADEETSTAREKLGRLTGEVIRTVREGIYQGFLDWSPRLLLAMYSCEIQASTEVLGRVYGVITRRRGRILSESMNEGTPFFTIVALLPVAESFGFSDEIRKRTSGAASPQLLFAGFEPLDEDPFWVPFTEEDLEDLGELADRDNVAKKYMDGVRMRKGMFVQGRKLIKDAEKQKNLKR
ncbi:hypothetical protein BDY21DRAFT_121148 [Lineolata rhizophorae]|uniref:Elongation factor-like 1 n=1 Tax=Lineolata rhizophorae TaxID=578093 RepID=A0A6A6NP70_9PEZI|nr:hypothetical protein BDY21DRAFT_121148 [Lineolata rhizophorae]